MRNNLLEELERQSAEKMKKNNCSTTIITKEDMEVTIKRSGHYYMGSRVITDVRLKDGASHSSASLSVLVTPVEVTVHYVTLAQVPTSQSVVKLAVISAVSATNHSRSDVTQCSIQRCTQPKGDVRDQSEDKKCDQVCDQSHNYEESEKGQIEPEEEINARI
eukprot:4488164-Amphidinium_carterae.1